ncbi:TetR/AcrR family transcriptional regulator [Phenylobacterium sp. J426]|uniref:TetR/AcrR family transcriptional regulator n=1 Tax=Phenylobacterium sp. J426 TaxID=2898439 RepID=UPI002151967A|nr:TetR/AcrR family transcriptional regulator [Phenylobacterium sp. J426]
MARARGGIDHQKTTALLKAAEALISRRGVGVSLVQIARSAGVSKQTLYNRFGGRTGFFTALAADQAANCPPPAIGQPAGRTPSEALERYAVEMQAYLNRPLTRELLAPRTIETEAAGAAWREDVLGRARRDLEGWFVQQANTGRLHVSDPDVMAALLIQLCVAETLAPIVPSGEPASPSAAKPLVSRVVQALFTFEGHPRGAGESPSPRT